MPRRSVDRAIDSFYAEGFGVARRDRLRSRIQPARVPDGTCAASLLGGGLCGGLVIATRRRLGLGRVGSDFWGYERHGLLPDRPPRQAARGNGHPFAAVVTTAELLDRSRLCNMYFNTFGGDTGLVGHRRGRASRHRAYEDLVALERMLGRIVRERLSAMIGDRPRLGPVKGAGLSSGSVSSLTTRGVSPTVPRPSAVEAVKSCCACQQDRSRRLRAQDPAPLALNGRRDSPVLLDALESAITEVLGDPAQPMESGQFLPGSRSWTSHS